MIYTVVFGGLIILTILLKIAHKAILSPLRVLRRPSRITNSPREPLGAHRAAEPVLDSNREEADHGRTQDR